MVCFFNQVHFIEEKVLHFNDEGNHSGKSWMRRKITLNKYIPVSVYKCPSLKLTINIYYSWKAYLRLREKILQK